MQIQIKKSTGTPLLHKTPLTLRHGGIRGDIMHHYFKFLMVSITLFLSFSFLQTFVRERSKSLLQFGWFYFLVQGHN